TGFNCVWRRGRIIQPRVVIDEFPAIGGLDELEAMPSNMIYMVEVYGNGSHIRVYTNQFIERLGRRPMAPIPLWW
ncbi:MAG: hypothetical protein GWN07_36145, partial [Actinobacteria bacterium]|nr:hypothetical protein [Actinomycetota bacterium]NIS36289.1 hypothetical protein [Actinomycetota bacterium]NIU70836.1 hypothetical protein [Actinomycetota bacterium]NIW32759.1 hypothetical protein [Actinomycetota bacterium]NIX24946.1 hypothetical protein [Actinomycetota bacterium]